MCIVMKCQDLFTMIYPYIDIKLKGAIVIGAVSTWQMCNAACCLPQIW